MSARRKKQRQLANYLHATGGRTGRLAAQVQAHPSYPPVPCMPQPPHAAVTLPGGGFAHRASRTVPFSHTSSNPYQRAAHRTAAGSATAPAGSIPLVRNLPAASSHAPLATPVDAAHLTSAHDANASKPLLLDSPMPVAQPPRPVAAHSAAAESLSASSTFSATTNLPSYYVTLPKNGSYLLDGVSARSLVDPNALPAAGFSIAAKLQARGIEVRPIPLLG